MVRFIRRISRTCGTRSKSPSLNDKNLKFTLPEPFVPFMDYLTFGVLPKHLLESVPPDQMANADFNINPVGSGPYKFDHLLVENGQDHRRGVDASIR